MEVKNRSISPRVKYHLEISVNPDSVTPMNLTHAETIVRGEMFAHGLTANGWVFKWDRAKSRYGSAHSARKVITLSAILTPLRDEADVRMTILHEIAHALVGTHHQHNAIWRRKFMSMGGDGKVCSPDKGAAQQVAKYVVTCKSNGHVIGHANRMLKNVPNRYCLEHRTGIVVSLNR